MNKKIATIVIFSLCLIVSLILIIQYFIKENIISDDNLLNSSVNQLLNEESNSSASSDNPSGDSSTASEKQRLAVLLTEGAEYTLPWADFEHIDGDTSDMYIKLESIEFTKDKGDLWVYGDHSTAEQSYAIVTITMKNLGDRSYETTLNRFYLITEANMGYELRGYNPDRPNEMTQDYYHVNFEPNKAQTYSLVYITDDDVVNENSEEIFLYVSLIDSGSDWTSGIPVIEKKG